MIGNVSWVKFLAVITLMIISFVLVACGNEDHPESSKENVNSATSVQTDSNQKDDTENSTVSTIKELNDCAFITTVLGNYATDYTLDDSHFDEDGFSCFYTPPHKINKETGEESGYITIIGKYSASMFETAEELLKSYNES